MKGDIERHERQKERKREEEGKREKKREASDPFKSKKSPSSEGVFPSSLTWYTLVSSFKCSSVPCLWNLNSILKLWPSMDEWIRGREGREKRR